jgi:hypothetical protein
MLLLGAVRMLLLGALKVLLLKPPFPAALRFAELFISRPPNVPALGFCIELLAAAPRNPAEPPALIRPPAGIAPTWF